MPSASRAFLVVLCSAISSIPLCLQSQSFTASIVGSVLDPSNAGIPEAKVTAINTGTNAEFAFRADSTGSYAVQQLPPGVYRLEAEAAGFRKYVQEGITLQVNQTARIEIRLSLGSATETVKVTA